MQDLKAAFRRTARIRAWAFCAASVYAFGIACASENPGGDTARVSVTPRTPVVRPTVPAGDVPAIRFDVKLVLVPVTVTDAFGAPVGGLPQRAFRLFENGIEQDVRYFGSDDAPISLGVIFDASRSMEGKLDQSRAAVTQVFRASMPGDEFFLVEFNDVPRLLCGFTSDTERIEKSLTGISPKNWTSLLDAVYLGIHQMKYAKHQRKALLILSDGADNASRYTEGEMKRLVREADVSIYSIGLTSGALLNRHMGTLKKLSGETGGLVQEVARIEDLPEAVAKVNRAVRNQYLLGFSSRNPNNDGMFRKIVVKLDHSPDLPPLRASWREGYYAPAAQ